MTKNDKLAAIAALSLFACIALVRAKALRPLPMLILVFASTVGVALTRWPEPGDRQATIIVSALAALFLLLIAGLLALSVWLSPHR
jgi:hypothetical protein